MIAFDGTPLPGTDQKVSASFNLAGKNLSGTGSMASTSEEGVKPKVLRCSTVLAMNELAELEAITELVEATDDNGERIAYTITNDLAKSMKIRRAKFTGNVEVTQDQQLKAWKISLRLVEVLSVAEKKQQQLDEQHLQEKAPPTSSPDEHLVYLLRSAEGQ